MGEGADSDFETGVGGMVAGYGIVHGWEGLKLDAKIVGIQG